MTHVFHRHTKTQYPTAVKGEGCFVIDQEGKRYFDGSCGAAVSCLGHSHPKVIETIQKQSAQLSFAHTSFFTNDPMEQLADHLVSHAPQGLEHVYFVSGGSEAVEAAIKLARQYFLESGQPQKHHIIARKQSYHGNTLGALSAGGNLWRRAQFEPLLVPSMSHVSACYAYRGKQEAETDDAYGTRLAQELETEILKVGAEKVAAFIAEPVVGATAGCVPGVEGYFKKIKAVCEKHGVLLILDEVMCGMGRTGTLFACEQDGVTADFITLAKGLGAGYQPIGALMVSDKIFKAIQNGSGFFQHGHTYMGHVLACATSLTVQKVIQEEGLLDQVKTMGARLKTALHQTFDSHPYVGDIRGRGLFIGVELVEDKTSKKPFDPAKSVNTKIKKLALSNGLMCYPMGGTIDGQLGDHIMLAPPFIMEEGHIELITTRLKVAIDNAIDL